MEYNPSFKLFKNMLNPDGSEIVNTEKRVVQLTHALSADQKMKMMVKHMLELEKRKHESESPADTLDFDIEEDTPDVSQFTDVVDKSKLRQYVTQIKETQNTQHTDGENPAVRKPAKTGRAKRVELDKNDSAHESATEGAEE